ncbi:MAG: GAF domain-containing protein [Chloroflexia bacterium]|nr:GAF domain-containing protein [Chloroflexia bacterium]
MQSIPGVYSTPSERVHRDWNRAAWRSLLIITLSVPAGMLLARVIGYPGTRVGFAAFAMASAAVAVFASLMLFRMTLSPLAVFAALAISFDAVSLAIQLLPYANWLPNPPRPLLLMWVYPTVLLAGVWYADTTRCPWHRQIRLALAITVFGAALVMALGLLALSLWVATLLDRPVWAGEHAGLLAMQSLLAVCLVRLYHKGDELAGWLLLSILPGACVGLLLAWNGSQDAVAVSTVRVGAFLIAGAGAWAGVRVSLSRATSGHVAMQLAERLRDALTGSVDPDVMARSVARDVASALDFDEVAVLLHTPDQKGLYVAGAYVARQADRSPGEVPFTPWFAQLVHDRSAGHPSPSNGWGGSRRQVTLPLMVRDQQLGFMVASRRSMQSVSESERALLDVALNQLAVGVANAQLLGQSQARLNRSEALRSLAVQASGSLTVDELGEVVMQHAKRLTGSNHAELFLRSARGVFMRSGDSAVMPATGLYEHVLRTRRVQVSGGNCASIAAPLLSADIIVGVLVVHSLRPSVQIGEEEEMAILALADQSVMSLESARLADQVRRTQAETDALYSISKDVSFVLGLKEGLQRVTERALSVLDYDVVVILGPRTDGGAMIQAASGTTNAGLQSGVQFPDSDFATPPQSLVVDELAVDSGLGSLYPRLTADCIVSVLVVPMRANGNELGALIAGKRVQHVATADQLFLAERISHQTAIAIENSRLLRSEQETVAKLRQLDEIKSTVIRSASHELRTPMAAIKGYTELLLETAESVLKPRQLQQLKIVSQQTDRVLKIVDSIITVSALEDGRLTMEPEVVDAGELLKTVALAVRSEAVARDISVRVDADAELVSVLADRRGIEIVLLNLLDNALKYSPAGAEVHLWTGAEAERVRFSVSDVGAGVSDEDRLHIFDKFHRGGSALDDAVPGVGLGLAICRGIIELHGGELGLAADSGDGARFWFTLPRPDDTRQLVASTPWYGLD